MKTFWLALSIAGALPVVAAYTLVALVAITSAFDLLHTKLRRRRAVATAERIIRAHITLQKKGHSI